MELLAQINTVSDSHLKDFILIGAFIISVVVNIVQLVRGGKPQANRIEQPLEVKGAVQFITKSECRLMHEAFEHRIAQIEERETCRDEKSSESRSRIYDKIEQVRKELSDKIDGMENRIIATLKNTGAI